MTTSSYTHETPMIDERPSYLVAFGLGMLVVAWKAPDALTAPQFWAEDGAIFFAEQYGHALPRLLSPYAGYLHAIPRLVAWLASAFPSEHAPTIFGYAAWLVASAALASLKDLELEHVPYAVLLGAVVLTPTNGEIWGTLTNVQWLLQLYQLSTLSRFIRGRASSHPLRLLAAVLVGLTGPFVIFTIFAAVALFIGMRLRTRSQKSSLPSIAWTPELTVLSVCAAAQLICISVSDTTSTHLGALTNKDLARFVSSVQTHVLTFEVLPRRLFRVLLVVTSIAALALTTPGKSRAVLLAIQLYVICQAAAVLRKFADETALLSSFEIADRYYTVVKLLVWWQLAVLLAAVEPIPRRIRTALMLFALALAASPAVDHLRRAPLRDLDWSEHARALDRDGSGRIPINPEPWYAIVPAPDASAP